VHGLNFAALTLWHLGYPDQARKKSSEALTLAQELAHPHSLVFALAVAALLHQFRREVEVVKERAEAMIALSSEQGFPAWLPLGMMVQGVALAEQGQEEEGIQQIQQGLAALRATGNWNWRSQFLALLAEAHGKVGQVKEGLDALAEALEAVDRTGARAHEAELYRLKGELTLAQSKVQSLNSKVTDPQAEAEACFLKAIEIARSQQAKSLELRAVMSLSRLWQQQGKQQEAHAMLSEIYHWFTEGFDTKDLQEAKALLEDLT
jgi:predicted ATPase